VNLSSKTTKVSQGKYLHTCAIPSPITLPKVQYLCVTSTKIANLSSTINLLCMLYCIATLFRHIFALWGSCFSTISVWQHTPQYLPAHQHSWLLLNPQTYTQALFKGCLYSHGGQQLMVFQLCTVACRIHSGQNTLVISLGRSMARSIIMFNRSIDWYAYTDFVTRVLLQQLTGFSGREATAVSSLQHSCKVIHSLLTRYINS